MGSGYNLNFFYLLEQIPGIAETCNFGAIMDGYYKTLFPLNPGGIRPIIPSDCEHEVLLKPHNREFLSSVENGVGDADVNTNHRTWSKSPQL